MIALKDLRLELRSGSRLLAMIAFVVLSALLFSVSLNLAHLEVRGLVAGLVWLTTLFAVTAGAGRAFDTEENDGAFRHVLLTPVSRGAIFLGKTAANWVLVWFVTMLAFFALTTFMEIRSPGPLAWHGAVFLPGTIGLAVTGTFFGRVSNHSTLGDTLLPVLTFPLLVPVVFFGATATSRILLERPWLEISGPVRFLWAFAVGSAVAGTVLFRHVADE